MNAFDVSTAAVAAIAASVLFSLGLAQLFLRFSETTVDRSRLQSVDGLRCFLALGVIFSHFPAHWAMVGAGAWGLGVAPVFAGFGSSAVTLFFMITGFLFYGKLRRSEGALDWKGLYLGRIFRLTPMYLVAIAGMFLLALHLTGWTVVTSPLRTASATFAWLAFTVPGDPPINGFANTRYLLAGAIWTLRFEWLFYLSLPLCAFVLRRFQGRYEWLVAGLILAAVVTAPIPDVGMNGFQPRMPNVGINWFRPRRLSPFFFGMIAYEITLNPRVAEVMRRPLMSVAVLVALFASFGVGAGYDAPRFLLMFAVFTPIACGNSIFGVLCWRATRAIGDASYSVYLLHGLILSLLFSVMGVGSDGPGETMVWLWLPVVCVVSVVISLATYRAIELPCMLLLRRRAAKTLEAAP